MTLMVKGTFASELRTRFWPTRFTYSVTTGWSIIFKIFRLPEPMTCRGQFPGRAKRSSRPCRRCDYRWRRRLLWNSWELQCLSAGPAETPFAAGSAAEFAVEEAASLRDPEPGAGDLDFVGRQVPNPLQVRQPRPASGYARISLSYGVPPPTLRL